jgi:hypothetical protein
LGYERIISEIRRSVGDAILITTSSLMAMASNPFGQDWIGYSFAYMAPYWTVCTIITGSWLTHVMWNESAAALLPWTISVAIQGRETSIAVSRTYIGRYRDQDSVQTCHSQLPEYLIPCNRLQRKSTLRLLNGVDRAFESGRMVMLNGKQWKRKNIWLVCAFGGDIDWQSFAMHGSLLFVLSISLSLPPVRGSEQQWH